MVYGRTEASIEEARKNHKAGDLEKAERMYRQILAASPNPDAAAGLGALLRSSRRHEEAKLTYQWAIKHCTWNPILVSNACNFLREQKQNNEALLSTTSIEKVAK